MVNWVNWVDGCEGCELRVFMVLSLYTIWLLWVEETQKSTQLSRERHRVHYCCRDGKSWGTTNQKFPCPVFSESHCHLSKVGRRNNSLRQRLVTSLDCSYSTHCPISNVLRGLMSCHFSPSCPFQCLSLLCQSASSFIFIFFSCHLLLSQPQSSSEPAAPLSPFIQKGRPEEKGLSDGEKPLKGGKPASRCRWGKKADGGPLWWSERSCRPSLCPVLWWWEGGSSGGA